MKFFLDENFPSLAKHVLQDRGYEITDIRGTAHEGIDDLALFKMAQTAQAIFLTTDRDFYHTVPLLFPNHHGVVAIALSQPNSRTIISKLEWALDHFLKTVMTCQIFLMTDFRFYQKTSHI